MKRFDHSEIFFAVYIAYLTTEKLWSPFLDGEAVSQLLSLSVAAAFLIVGAILARITVAIWFVCAGVHLAAFSLVLIFPDTNLSWVAAFVGGFLPILVVWANRERFNQSATRMLRRSPPPV